MSLLDTAFSDNIPWISVFPTARSSLIFTRQGVQPTAEYRTGEPSNLTLTKGEKIFEPRFELWSSATYSSTGSIDTVVEPDSPEDSDPNFFQSIVIIQPGLLNENYRIVINGAFRSSLSLMKERLSPTSQDKLQRNRLSPTISRGSGHFRALYHYPTAQADLNTQSSRGLQHLNQYFFFAW
jgi:hypothetical protein